MNAALKQYPECNVYFQSPVVESANPKYFDSEEGRDYISAPLSFYPLVRSPNLISLDGKSYTLEKSTCSVLMVYDWDVRHILKERVENPQPWALALANFGQDCVALDKVSTIKIFYCRAKGV